MKQLQKVLYSKYGTMNPDNEFHSVWNELRQTYELYSVRQLIDGVNRMLENSMAHKRFNRMSMARNERLDEDYAKLLKGEKITLTRMVG